MPHQVLKFGFKVLQLENLLIKICRQSIAFPAVLVFSLQFFRSFVRICRYSFEFVLVAWEIGRQLAVLLHLCP